MPEPRSGAEGQTTTSESRIPQSRLRDDSAAQTFLILTVAACGMAALLALLPAAGHDQMWLLYAARLLLHGAPLYGSQVFETNPPLVIWLSTVPAGLAGLTHLPDTAWGKFFLLALEFGVAALCLRLLRIVRPALNRGTVLALAFVYVTVFAAMPARDFGQRDHLLILFILPYVFAAAVRMEGRSLAAWQGWLAGVMGLAGVALKPHQVLIPVAVEAMLLVSWARRRGERGRVPLLRPEFFAMVLAGCAFLAAIRVFAPLYFSVILPIVGDTYWAYHQLTFAELVGESIQLHLLLAVDAVLLAATWRRTSPVAWVLFVAGVASTLAFYLQGTGWYYQQLPALSLLSLTLAFLLIDAAQRRGLAVPKWLPVAATGLGLLALGLTTHFMDYPFTDARSFPVDTPAPELFAGVAPGTAVMVLSSTVDYTIQPVYKYHLTLGERYPAFLMLPALLRSEDPQGKRLTHHIPPARLAELDRMQHAFMVEDLERWRPQLLLVERCEDPAVGCQVLEDRHDNLLAWFERDPAFGEEFARYTYVRSAGRFDEYRLR